jgi:hypothetical protein
VQTPDEVIKTARKRMHKRAKARGLLAEKFGKMHEFKVGDLVLKRSRHLSSKIVKVMSKFFYIFEGPYVINKIIGPNAYLISDIKTGAAMGSQNVKT